LKQKPGIVQQGSGGKMAGEILSAPALARTGGEIASMNERQRIVEIVVAPGGPASRRPEVESDRRVAIQDLLEDNSFSPIGLVPGPYRLEMKLDGARLLLDVQSQAGAPLGEMVLPLAPLRAIMRDYFMICDSYYDAVKNRPAQIEAIDMGRRAVHNEASELLRDKLATQVDMDLETARRLFTLLCVMKLNG
jgi:uncharacterized protein (UPF0262 family)